MWLTSASTRPELTHYHVPHSVHIQAGDLQNAAVRLRSQLEQGEAQRHSLEYQLTLAQKDSRLNLDLLEQKDKEWNTLNQSLQGVLLNTHQASVYRPLFSMGPLRVSELRLFLHPNSI